MSIEPDETAPTNYARNITICGNTFWLSDSYDIAISFSSAPTSNKMVDGVSITGNAFRRSGVRSDGSGTANVYASILMFNGKNILFSANEWKADNAYTSTYNLMVFYGYGGAAFTDNIVIRGNRGIVTTSAGIAGYIIDLATGAASPFCTDNCGLSVVGNDFTYPSAVIQYDSGAGAVTNNKIFIDERGAGAPILAASPGSRWANTGGGSGTSLYVKESGTNNTGWVAK